MLGWGMGPVELFALTVVLVLAVLGNAALIKDLQQLRGAIGSRRVHPSSPVSASFHRRSQDVAAAAHSLDERWTLGVGLDLPP
jgi:hypothetical protein